MNECFAWYNKGVNYRLFMSTNTATKTIESHPPSWLRELYEFRNLIYFFTWRYLKVRYKQTALGILWVILQPLFLAGIVSLFIFRGLNIDFGYVGVPIIISAFIGFALWVFFDKTVNTISNSLISNRNIMLKVYFPKMIPPLASAMAGMTDLLFALGLFLILLLITTTAVHLVGFLFALLAIAMLLLITFSLGLFLAALNVEYRDASQITPFIFRVGIFVSPVFYPVSFLPDAIQPYIYLNPLAGIIELFRNGFFDPSMINWTGTLISAAVALAFFVVGLWLFRKKEHYLVDVI